MKHIKLIAAVAFTGLLLSGCKKYLDVNSDPASPQSPDIGSLFAPVTGTMSAMMLISPISAGQYTQNWSAVRAEESIWDIHAGNAGGAAATGLWRQFYAQPGAALNLVIKKGIIEEKWDYVGAAIALRAWGLQQTTDYFGPMPFYQAWDDSRTTYAYDPQETIYKVIDSLCHVSLTYLSRTDGASNQSTMSRGDQVYKGDRTKWSKFVYGLLARNWHRRTNKADYNADSVIYYVDKSFASNADNFYVVHSATRNDDTNPAGPARDNFTLRRQSRFIVQLLDGTNFYGNTLPASRDPRIRGMLSVSPDTSTTTTNMPAQNGGYRYLIPGTTDPNTAAPPVISPVTGLPTNPLYRQRVSTPYGDSAIVNPGIANFTASTGKYLFQNKREFPIMTYHELQFIKAEAAFRKNNLSMAASAYHLGITNTFDFINFLNTSATNVSAISSAQRDAYMSSAAVKDAATITLTDIMLQKYIGDWGWNLIESWADMRRYHYFDTDPLTGAQVYRGYALTIFSSNNQGPKPAYRYRPTNFSEYDWNLEELRKIGVLNVDYHTYEMWFSQP
jgi:hypothetical protein